MQWLKKHRKASLYEAIEKLKSGPVILFQIPCFTFEQLLLTDFNFSGFCVVLMLLGFMSLLLTVTQRSISKICISNKEADFMLPCRSRAGTKTTKSLEHFWAALNDNYRDTRPETYGDRFMFRNERGLKEDNSYNSLDHCSSQVIIITRISPPVGRIWFFFFFYPFL